MYRQNSCQDPLKNWFGRQRSLGSRKDNPRKVDFDNNNAVRDQKHFKPIANGNVADSGMIALTAGHFHVQNLKKNESLNVNLE